ncbi:MAG: hypothetical protein WDO16_08715 [Bacteroidota bacterium]
MRKTMFTISNNAAGRKIRSLLLPLLVLFAGKGYSQACTLDDPTFFGLAPSAPQRAFIYCKSVDIGYGVFLLL